MRYQNKVFAFLALLIFTVACGDTGTSRDVATSTENPPLNAIASPPIKAVIESALEQTKLTRGYSQQYFVMPYPNGDPPTETGACTDVVIRAFRKAGVDLQKEVHEDMAAHFADYPQKWGLSGTDTNIDHRRVPNLQTFFKRQGKSLPVTATGEDYKPGDVVTWDLDGKGMTHIGLVSNRWDDSKQRYLVIHNIGGGTNLENVLFNWKITGHFRYF